MKKNIFVNQKKINDNVEISKNCKIICDTLSIGEGTVITGGTTIQCKKCIIGKNNFINGITIEGSLTAGNTTINIGNENLILQNTRLNCNDHLEIGDDVNIGQYVSIWTHASSMNVFDGYPYTKKPVKIGSHAWITAGTTVMPGVNIGSNVIIGNLSVVNRDIPDGCFAAGVPVKIIKENVFPKKLSIEEKRNTLIDAINEYNELIQLKPFKAKVEMANDLKIRFSYGGRITEFDCDNKRITGEITEYSEDFRDFLRYRGIKFFTDKGFKSIKPIWYSTAIKNNIKK
jgi:acetyltransferase-like isoleucine patch superfamily enzyme